MPAAAFDGKRLCWVAGWLCNKPQAPKLKKFGLLLNNEECLFQKGNMLCFRGVTYGFFEVSCLDMQGLF
jgi:hypothetical protein